MTEVGLSSGFMTEVGLSLDPITEVGFPGFVFPGVEVGSMVLVPITVTYLVLVLMIVVYENLCLGGLVVEGIGPPEVTVAGSVLALPRGGWTLLKVQMTMGITHDGSSCASATAAKKRVKNKP